MHKIFSIEMVHIELTCNDESNYSNLDSLRYTKLQGMPADGFAEKAKKDEKDPKAAANAGAINSMQATDKNGKTNVKARRDQKWYSWGCQSTQGGRAALHSEFHSMFCN